MRPELSGPMYRKRGVSDGAGAPGGAAPRCAKTAAVSATAANVVANHFMSTSPRRVAQAFRPAPAPAALKGCATSIRSQQTPVKPTRMIRGARISDGARYVVPTAGFRLTIGAALPTLKKSTCGVKCRAPNRNALETRRSTLVTLGKRSSPRLLSRTVWLERVSATPCVSANARVTEKVDTYG